MKVTKIITLGGLFLIGTVAGIIGINLYSGALFAGNTKASGFPIDANGGSAAPAAATPDLPPDWGTLLGDPAKLAELTAKGATGAKVCAACHDITTAGANKTGPALAGVVGRTAGTHPGFAYSDAMKGFGKSWSLDELNTYLKDPKATVPGNKMAFAGIKKQEDRIAVIAYLRSISPSAPALPAPGANAPAAPAANAAANATDASANATAPAK